MQGGGSAVGVATAAFRGLGRKGVVVPGVGNLIATQLSRFLTRRLSVLLGAQVVGRR